MFSLLNLEINLACKHALDLLGWNCLTLFMAKSISEEHPALQSSISKLSFLWIRWQTSLEYNVNAYELLDNSFWICLLILRCEPFPTYPRTYDMLHANGLVSHLTSERCSMIDLFLEMDRILRPEVWRICLYTFSLLFVLESIIIDFVLLQKDSRTVIWHLPIPFHPFSWLILQRGWCHFGRCSFQAMWL